MERSPERISHLTFSEILSEKDKGKKEESYINYTKSVGEENPFFPMKEGVVGKIDQTKVKRTFDNACTIYTNIMDKNEKYENSWQPARLYKLNGVGEAAAPFKKTLLVAINHLKNKDPEEIKKIIQKIKNCDNHVVKTVGQVLFATQSDLCSCCPKPGIRLNENKLKTLIKNMGKEIEEVVSRGYAIFR